MIEKVEVLFGFLMRENNDLCNKYFVAFKGDYNIINTIHMIEKSAPHDHRLSSLGKPRGANR